MVETVEVHCQLVLYTNKSWEKDLPYCNPHQPNRYLTFSVSTGKWINPNNNDVFIENILKM